MRTKGTVLVFREGTDDEQIRRALYAMRQILEPRYHTDQRSDGGHFPVARIENFDLDADGWPVWYIP